MNSTSTGLVFILALLVGSSVIHAQPASKVHRIGIVSQLSYGGNTEDSYRRAVSYVDRILKGAKPGDLPVDQATRFELVVNLKTAKALGIKIPRALLLRTDRVIE